MSTSNSGDSHAKVVRRTSDTESDQGTRRKSDFGQDAIGVFGTSHGPDPRGDPGPREGTMASTPVMEHGPQIKSGNLLGISEHGPVLAATATTPLAIEMDFQKFEGTFICLL